MTILTFLIYSLAVYRLSHLIVFDKIFEPIRKHFVTRNFKGPVPTYTLQGGAIRRFIGQVMNCYWCAGVWVSALVVLGYIFAPTITFYIELIFAFSAFQALIETGLLKTVGMPLEMMEVKRETVIEPKPDFFEDEDGDPINPIRGFMNAVISTLIIALIIFGSWYGLELLLGGK